MLKETMALALALTLTLTLALAISDCPAGNHFCKFT